MFVYKCMHLFSKTKCILKYKCMDVNERGYGMNFQARGRVEADLAYACVLVHVGSHGVMFLGHIKVIFRA